MRVKNEKKLILQKTVIYAYKRRNGLQFVTERFRYIHFFWWSVKTGLSTISLSAKNLFGNLRRFGSANSTSLPSFLCSISLHGVPGI